MKRLFIIIIALSLLIALAVTGCQALEKGSGKLKTEDFNFNDFSNVEIDGPFEVSIAYAEAYRISITADDNIFGGIAISKQGNTLRLSLPQSRFFGIRRTHYVDATAKAVITMPQLRSLLL